MEENWGYVALTTEDSNPACKGACIVANIESAEGLPRHQVLRILQMHASARESPRIVLCCHVHRRQKCIHTCIP